MADTKKLVVDLQPVGRRVEVPTGSTILDASRSVGAGVISLCGGEGWCGSCQVKIVRGEANPPSQSEIDTIGEDRLQVGYRLACQTVPISDVRVDIPPDSLSTPQRLQVEGKKINTLVSPAVSWVDLGLTPPELEDLAGDADRVCRALAELGIEEAHVELPALKCLSDKIRKYDWTARFVLRRGEVISVLPEGSKIYGISVDIGTTKVAVYLVDLESGEIVEKAGAMNPQIVYGEDVISRISYTQENEGGRGTLQEVITEAINSKIEELCRLTGILRDQLVDSVVVGNTAMHHLFAGLPVDQLAVAPYVPSINKPLDVRARDLGVLMAPGAYIHLLPNIAGYVGADHAAMILSTELWNTKETVLAIDIGTNTEISLVHQGKIYCCSCASGPAFEGAHITFGMRAAPGAIEKMRIIGGEIVIYTIEDQEPVGICGSGILDVIAEMRIASLVDEKGAIRLGSPFTIQNDQGLQELVLVPAERTGIDENITVSRKDINEIQLAKAAIRTGVEILLAHQGILIDGVDKVILAGAFGTYINIPSAVEIGMFPDIPLERFFQVGNAAGMGAVQALISVRQRELISDVVKDVNYVELTTCNNFQDIYMQSMYLH